MTHRTKQRKHKKTYRRRRRGGAKNKSKKQDCPDNKTCKNFSDILNEELKQYDFNTFEKATGSIKKIGQESVNGFVYAINYNVNDNIAHAVLKSSSKADGDNLLYEYIVGLYVNKLNMQYPCFIETYGYREYANTEVYDKMRNAEEAKESNYLKTNTTNHTDLNYALACEKPLQLALLIQHLNGIQDVYDELEDSNSDVIFNIMHILYQLYVPLDQLKNNFNHNDLHGGNVCLVPLFPNKPDAYITMNYIFQDEKKNVSFKTKYLVKIIDYGRCFFYENENNNSKLIYDTICKTPDCNKEIPQKSGKPKKEECGNYSGFIFTELASLRNVSNDLLFLHRLRGDNSIVYKTKFQYIDEIYNKQSKRPKRKYKSLDAITIVKQVAKMCKMVLYNPKDGVVIERSSDCSEYNFICNVTGMAQYITKIVKQKEYIALNNEVYMKTKESKPEFILNIYADEPGRAMMIETE